MEIVESYNIKELSLLQKTPYNRIKIDKDYYIPVKFITAQSRATKRWYTIRYVKAKDIKDWLEDNKSIKRYCKRK